MPEANIALPNTTIASKVACLLIPLALLLSAGPLPDSIRHSQFFINATTHKPERLTELYFTDPAHLPVRIMHGKPFYISFTIHNLEGRNMMYAYRIVLSPASGKSLIVTQKDISLPNNKSQVVTINTVLPAQAGRFEIDVSLVNRAENIHFWIEGV